MLKIGLTGGIGSGKSAAAEMFERLGVHIVDADIVAREVVEPGEPALQEIADHFGSHILLADGGLDRRQLREIVFSDAAEKKWLEAALHPRIRERIQAQLNQARPPYILLVSPLLLETDQHQLVDRIVVVTSSPALQVQRTGQRDRADAESVRRIMRSQWSDAKRLQRADYEIQNVGDLHALEKQVKRLHQELVELAARPATRD